MKLSKFHIRAGAVVAFLLWIAVGIGGSYYHFSQDGKIHKESSTQKQISSYEIKATSSIFLVNSLQPNYFLLFETPFLVISQKVILCFLLAFCTAFFEKVFEHLIAPKAP